MHRDSHNWLPLFARNFPPVAVEIAEEKRSVLAVCFDLFEIFDFPSPAIGLKRPVSIVHGIDRIHRQCETLIAGKTLAVLLERLNTDHVPRRGWMFDITRAGPQLHHFEAKYFAVEALRSFEILVFQSAMGKSLGNVALARKLFCWKRVGPVRICRFSHARFYGMLVGLDLPIVPAGFVEMNRISVVVAPRFDDLDAEFSFFPFQIFSSAIDFGIVRYRTP